MQTRALGLGLSVQTSPIPSDEEDQPLPDDWIHVSPHISRDIAYQPRLSPSAQLRPTAKGRYGFMNAAQGDRTLRYDIESGLLTEGDRFQQMTPGGTSTRPAHYLKRRNTLAKGSDPLSARDLAELNVLLGDSHSRIKSGAEAILSPGQERRRQLGNNEAMQPVILEQAKPHPRVEVDIMLDNSVHVQGGYMRGYLNINVNPVGKKDIPIPIRLAQGQLRVFGFESIRCSDAGDQHERRHGFFQVKSTLSQLIPGYLQVLCRSAQTDDEGYAEAIEGVHTLPFSLHLPSEGNCGIARGSSNIKSAGAIVQYIILL